MKNPKIKGKAYIKEIEAMRMQWLVRDYVDREKIPYEKIKHIYDIIFNKGGIND